MYGRGLFSAGKGRLLVAESPRCVFRTRILDGFRVYGAFWAGFGFLFVGSLSDAWLQRHTGSFSIATIDDALVGLVAGLLVFLYERRQRQNLIKKPEVIRLMNHHVRNSLQVISIAASVPQRVASTEQLQEAVERIEWALREVLPGQREDIRDLLVPPRSEEMLLSNKERCIDGTR